MSFIYRELVETLEKYFLKPKPTGLILSGVVGCGKTTAVNYFLEKARRHFDVFCYTGDDLQFRQNVSFDSRFILNEVKAKAKKKQIFVFIDEVQKSEEVFDALKIAFDEGRISFLVTGSNPAYLSTVAKKRLQRRADQILMLPISLRELCVHNNFAVEPMAFEILLRKSQNLNEIVMPKNLDSPEIKQLISSYFKFGGLPLALLGEDEEDKLREIRLTTERGFDLMVRDNASVAEAVRIELAKLQSQEFTYKTIFDNTRTRQRELVNKVIDELMNHGYLFKKTPKLLFPGKSSYLSVFSYTDPGIVNYLSYNHSVPKGYQIEGYVHSRLSMMIYNSVYKAEIHYFKPHEVDTNGNIRYQKGEIDFIYSLGKRMIPIEVKAAVDFKKIDTKLIAQFIKDQKCPFGVVLFEGQPYIDFAKKILFWPYWLI